MKIFSFNLWISKSLELNCYFYDVFMMSLTYILRVSYIIRISAGTDGRVLIVYHGSRAAHNVTKRRRRQMGLVPRHWLRPTYTDRLVLMRFVVPLARAAPATKPFGYRGDPPFSSGSSTSRNGRSCARARARARENPWYNSRTEDFSADVVPTESYLLSESNKLSRIKSEPPSTRVLLQEEPRPASWKRNRGEDTVYGVSSESRRSGIMALLYSTTLFSSA